MGIPHNKSHGKIPNWPSHRWKLVKRSPTDRQIGSPQNKVMVKYRTGQVTGGNKWREEQPSKIQRNPQQTGTR